jgi:hypothetical protein
MTEVRASTLAEALRSTAVPCSTHGENALVLSLPAFRHSSISWTDPCAAMSGAELRSLAGLACPTRLARRSRYSPVDKGPRSPRLVPLCWVSSSAQLEPVVTPALAPLSCTPDQELCSIDAAVCHVTACTTCPANANRIASDYRPRRPCRRRPANVAKLRASSLSGVQASVS